MRETEMKELAKWAEEKVRQENEKEKLIDLLTAYFGVDPMYYGVEAQHLADHLIANGVTLDKDDSKLSSKWIPVTERLPEYGVKVLAYAKNSIEGRTFVAIFRKQRNKGMWWDSEWSIEVLSVTHWMPIPQPPKGE